MGWVELRIDRRKESRREEVSFVEAEGERGKGRTNLLVGDDEGEEGDCFPRSRGHFCRDRKIVQSQSRVVHGGIDVQDQPRTQWP